MHPLAWSGSNSDATTGPTLRHWPDVVVPTGLALRDPVVGHDSWPERHGSSLFGSFYDEEVVERFELSGSARTDIDSESVFLRFAPRGNAHKPLDLRFGPAGRLWVLTQTGIWRVDRIR